MCRGMTKPDFAFRSSIALNLIAALRTVPALCRELSEQIILGIDIESISHSANFSSVYFLLCGRNAIERFFEPRFFFEIFDMAIGEVYHPLSFEKFWPRGFFSLTMRKCEEVMAPVLMKGSCK
jgi:hypothetical protein